MGLFDLFRNKKKRNAGQSTMVDSHSIPSQFDINTYAAGALQTVVIGVTCGLCHEKWDDAVRPNAPESLTCPHCGASNAVTLNLHVIQVDNQK